MPSTSNRMRAEDRGDRRTQLMRDAADEGVLEEIRLQPQVRIGERRARVDPLECRRGLGQDRLDAIVELARFPQRLLPKIDRQNAVVGGPGRDRLERPHATEVGIDQKARARVPFGDHLGRLRGEPRGDDGIVDRNLAGLLPRLDEERLAAEMARQIVLYCGDEIGVRRTQRKPARQQIEIMDVAFAPP
jgi:hypothetical protein